MAGDTRANLEFVLGHVELVVALVTRFGALTPELLARHRRKLDKNLLAQNPTAPSTRSGDSSGVSYPTTDPGLDEAWTAFVSTSQDGAMRSPPGDARALAFLDAHQALLDARYVTGYSMQGRDWGAEDKTGWALLAHARSLDWSESLVVALADRLDFGALSANTGVPWTGALLERFRDRWSWDAIARNEALPWSEALLERFPSIPLAALSWNPRFPWSAAFLERHADQLDWCGLSRNTGVAWTEALADRFAAHVDWNALVTNPAYPASEALLAAHADVIDWEALGDSFSFVWTPAILRRFADRVSWRALSARGAFWTAGLVEEHVDRVDFGAKGLSANARMTWSRELFERHADRFDRREISRNPALWAAVFAPALDAATLDQLLAAAPDRKTGRTPRNR